MNAVERILEGELMGLVDRLASSLPEGALAKVVGATPTLKPRLDEAEARLAEARGALLTDYGRWCRALEDLENLWALANWRSTAQETVDQTRGLVAA
jgi:hypothetical protein